MRRTHEWILNEADFAREAMPILLGLFRPGMWIYLKGDLGAGKSSVVRQCLQAWGVVDRIKSPTYTLMESYPISGDFWGFSSRVWVHHLDLYRLTDPEELYFLGLDSGQVSGVQTTETDTPAIYCVEWPEKGQGVLPQPAWVLEIEVIDDRRRYQLCQGDAPK